MNNQKGQSILLVVAGISTLLIALPLGLTAYWKNNLVAASRVREAYNLMNATEQAARDVRADWDIAIGDNVVGAAPTVIQNYVVFTMPTLVPPQAIPDVGCSATCAAANSGVVPTLCYPNAANPAAPYCFYGTLMSPNALYLELKIPNEKKPDFLERTGYQIAQALDYLHIKKNNSALSFEKMAYAAPPNRTDVTGGNLGCTAASTNPACLSCGNTASNVAAGDIHVAQHRPCTLIYACPISFPACATYNGTAAKAIFSQQFFVLPNNDTN